jgi:outer membrane protein TolC
MMRRGLLLALLLSLAACSSAHYRRSADTEVGQAIARKSPAVPNMDARFTLDTTNTLDLTSLPPADPPPEFLGAASPSESNGRRVNLETALDLAIHHSRAYQTSKEQLYLSALALTLARHQFAPLFSSSTAGGIAGQTEQTTEFIPDPIDPTKPRPVLSDSLVEQNSVNANGSVRTDWLIRDLGRISASFVADFSRFITGDPRTFTSSSLGATFTRPLFRNAGFKQEQEALLQAERDLLYAIRTFTRFRKDFTVQIASDYYNVLGARDGVRNAHANLQSSRSMAQRSRALAAEGRTTQADLGRIEQQTLTAENAWINTIRTYRQALDNFKIRLGLSTDAPIVLDDRDLAQLAIHHPEIDPDDATRIALHARLDYLNTRDQSGDARRRVKLAADGLKTQVDLVASTSISNDPSDTSGFPVPKLDRYRWNAGLDVDLPLNRKAQRNSYRAALIAEGQAQRAVLQAQDDIKLEVRDGWRLLGLAKRSYEISEIGVKLAERRVEEQNLLAELSRARAQDQVDAQNALIESRNQRTQALVSHTIARLRFWNSMGILYVKDNGQWQESNP